MHLAMPWIRDYGDGLLFPQIDLIHRAAAPVTHRRPTKPSNSAKQLCLDAKRRSGSIKKGRGRVNDED